MIEEVIAFPGQPKAHPWLSDRMVGQGGLKKTLLDEQPRMKMYGFGVEALDVREAKNLAAIVSFDGQEDRADEVRVASHPT